jgi:hypothetical protein
MSEWASKKAAHVYDILETAEPEAAIRYLAIALREAHGMGMLAGIEQCERITNEAIAKALGVKSA